MAYDAHELRESILELFVEAAHRAPDRLLAWAARITAREARWDREAYERQSVAAKLQSVGLRQTICPVCNLPAETRPGTRQVFHVGESRLRCAGSVLAKPAA